MQKKLTGLQRDVLSLYRACLRQVRLKPVDTRDNFRNFAREEFHKHINLNKKDFDTIEHLLRVGRRKLEVYSMEGIKNISR
ncbi:complex 1 protein-domain-containing protein [Peziza echinospora]|nr:complex 1 protein-domain-containing protein [Peziza echinospora]